MDALKTQAGKMISNAPRPLAEMMPWSLEAQVEEEGLKRVKIEGEFWSSKQRKSHSLHEVSYRACFKSQLPQFFIDRFTKPGDYVLDPFSGRGTTALQAAMMGRNIMACDINPLASMLLKSRLDLPTLAELETLLTEIGLLAEHDQPPSSKKDHLSKIEAKIKSDDPLLTFYHKKTLAELLLLREYLGPYDLTKKESGLNCFLRMVATSRLSGHSNGFFSVYTLPPNQAVSLERQQKLNEKNNLVPEYRSVGRLILKKSKSLLRNISDSEKSALRQAYKNLIWHNGSAASLPTSRKKVALTVTSPPFLDVIPYLNDNWLRLWFNQIESDQPDFFHFRSVAKWLSAMTQVLRKIRKNTIPGGWLAFETGEVRGGKLDLEEVALQAVVAAGFEVQAVLYHRQIFTKTAHIWGVTNNKRGTNSQRIVLARNP